MKILVGKEHDIIGIHLTYWGMSQWYKFRWHGTHIDLGIISIYDLPQKGWRYGFWRGISILIKPLRWFYHRRFVNSLKAKRKNFVAEIEMGFHDEIPS